MTDKRPTVRINIWPDPDSHGFFWDVSEDHGGYDRCSPMGPWHSIPFAREHAERTFNTATVVATVGNPPDHYTDARGS
jgi:hypothetical protein